MVEESKSEGVATTMRQINRAWLDGRVEELAPMLRTDYGHGPTRFYGRIVRGERYCATSRDLWIFQQQGHAWLAVWRTMLDLNENAA